MAYRVDWSVLLERRMEELQAEALESGQGNAFRVGLERLLDRLEGKPHDVGEIAYRTPMGFPVHVAVSGPTAINFVIYESHQAVCLTKIDRLSS